MSRTASQLRTQARRLDRVYLQMANLVRIMRDEAALYLQFRASGPVWWLTNGRHVPESVALRVTTNPQVIPVGDALLHSSSRARFWPPAIAQGHKCPPAGFCRLLRPGRRWDCHGDEVPKPKPVFAILDIRAHADSRRGPATLGSIAAIDRSELKRGYTQ
jgi:hypothetical protein